MRSTHEVCYGTVRYPAVVVRTRLTQSNKEDYLKCNITKTLQLFDAFAKPIGDTNVLRSVKSAQTLDTYGSFRLQNTNGLMELCSDDGVKFAILDLQTTTKLQSLNHIAGTRFEAVVELRNFAKRKIQNKGPFSLTVNILGPRDAADEVSLTLSQIDVFLQHPQALDSSVDYFNPDMLVFPGDEPIMRKYIGIGTPSWKHEHLVQDIEKILGSLGHDAASGGDELCPLGGLKSALTRHQEAGTRFVLMREDTTLSRNLSAQICKATGAQHYEQEDDQMALGGIIADVMGLGKTLTTLASILRSSEKALDFAFASPALCQPKSDISRMKATLVVVPSAQLLENWESEINSHFNHDALRYVRFHGQNRPRQIDALREYDIVLTTYATLAADHSGQGLMYRMEWYRIVLDEAHWIRNSSSKQFKAAAGLISRRRWCLSGTPIQNKLDDLASLAQFLRIYPISSKETFQRYIFTPLADATPDSKPLRAYMEACCLRRTESCLTLPASREQFIPLRLSTREREVYDQVLDNTRRQIDELVSTGKNVRCTKLFTALLRLRMICNLGTFPMANNDETRANASALGRTNGLAHQCERCSTLDEDTLMLLSTCEVCPDCMRPLHQRSPSPLPPTIGRQDNIPLVSIPIATDQQGFSTKLNAVVNNVAKTSGSENKTIVFSYWKSTLRILARLLSLAGISYIQVDGDTSYAERSTYLKAFKEQLAVHVLLMTIETGAVGLNLTVASRVHIIEPQWNPSIEEQAVARALRMGQRSEVIIFRYVMQNTVEQNVVNLQKRKSGLAKFTLGSESQDNISNTLQELETVLDLRPQKRAASEM